MPEQSFNHLPTPERPLQPPMENPQRELHQLDVDPEAFAREAAEGLLAIAEPLSPESGDQVAAQVAVEGGYLTRASDAITKEDATDLIKSGKTSESELNLLEETLRVLRSQQ